MPSVLGSILATDNFSHILLPRNAIWFKIIFIWNNIFGQSYGIFKNQYISQGVQLRSFLNYCGDTKVMRKVNLSKMLGACGIARFKKFHQNALIVIHLSKNLQCNKTAF